MTFPARTTLLAATAVLAAAGLACAKAPEAVPRQASMQASARIHPVSDAAAGLDPAHFWMREKALETVRP